MNKKLNPIPVLPLRDIVVFPNMIVRLFVGREKSVFALEEVMKTEQQISPKMPNNRGKKRITRTLN